MPKLIINSVEQLSAWLDGNAGPAALYFTARWCGPCKALKPKLHAMLPRFPNTTLLEIDIDDLDEVAAKFKVGSVPTLVFFVGARVTGRIAGGSAEAISAHLEKIN